MNINHIVFFFILGSATMASNFCFAQNRQPDSIRYKQQQYAAKLKADSIKAKQKAIAEENQKKSIVTTYDSKGNKVETSRNKAGEKVTVITIKRPPILNRPFNADTINKDSIILKVFKSKNRLQVYHNRNILTAYKCVFGPNAKGQKEQEGDRKTPEGVFTIVSSKPHDKWDIFMMLDYPNEASIKIFEANKANGLLPKSAKIGGLIGIHGVWYNGDNVIDLKHNWTDGCISLKNNDIEELNKVIKPGVTFIEILP
jgi:lipoprotein-anchoring transpeptidase ErfK/SrfK